MIKQELRSIWNNKMLTLSIAVMFFMPILYSGMLLWAFWDPYSKVDQLPVALVNEDTGAILDEEEIQLGKELIDNLTSKGTFNYTVLNSKEAAKKLEDNEIYLLIKIPENFSEHATTLLDENPSKLEIEYKANEGYNFLSSKIGDTAIETIRTEVNKQVAETYVEQLYNSIGKLGGGFSDAAEGAKKRLIGIDQFDESGCGCKMENRFKHGLK